MGADLLRRLPLGDRSSERKRGAAVTAAYAAFGR
jgi:hypothetical protein